MVLSERRLESATVQPLIYLAAGLFGLLVIRTAWLCDDAYINFRTVDNFLHGFGLRWNVDERVQTFTDPLWLLLISGLVAITSEYYFSTIALSVLLSVAAVLVYARRVVSQPWPMCVGILTLGLSKAYVDYSTSGLENPLTHLLVAGFYAQYWALRKSHQPAMTRLAILAALCGLTRNDAALLVVPALVDAVQRAGVRRSVRSLLAGAMLVALWEGFTLFYYGVPFPNTAYAKLGGAVPWFERTAQGFSYLLDSINRDPVTLVTIVSATVAAFLSKDRQDLTPSAGILLVIAFVVWAGGDFMSGRFLTAPLFVAVMVLTRRPWPVTSLAAVPILLLLVAGLAAEYPSVLTDRTFRHDFTDRGGTVDERRVYFPYSALLNAGRTGPLAHPWARRGRELASHGERVTEYGANGFFGFAAGPGVHVVDTFALGDVLLARLPAGAAWRPGHLPRRLPQGYLETLRSGLNEIAEPGVAAYHEQVRRVTRGSLVSLDRARAIWDLNLGHFDRLLEGSSYGIRRLSEGDVRDPKGEGAGPGTPGVLRIGEGGVEVRLDRAYSSGRLEISLDGNDDYLLVYIRDGDPVAHQYVRARWPDTDGALGLAVHVIDPPPKARGFVGVRIYGRRGFGPAYFGHLRLTP